MRRLGAIAPLLLLAATLGACKHAEEDITASVPSDYRQRHPIVVQEADRTVEVFVGTGRGGLMASQRTDVAAFAQTWLQEGTGPITIDLPVSTTNARAATQSLHDIQEIFSSVGVPARGVTIRRYTPPDYGQFATIKLNYPKVIADAGPCGLWREDLGPSFKSPIYQSNRPYSNLGCAYQRNMAAMVANPADLVQPRPESPSYTPRRSTVLGRYANGEPTATKQPDADKGKISDVGK
ncbi:CpaD family pilus assembly protein [Bradyrhizobium sp. LHD-71]|uniref:CpaD family pilus assembly protein n=1 Tax=Bradyrhizobium sp. LHD-71 TaxID=3072141 RepID=UPI00280F18ED|nr:CpaD family pilus assembly protein [Bradyrhizobium sp. LHD-71]MDQ8727011.1 CpaD family pilus assembly protein [Bradyrhizobium sp. LHD-71]